MITGLLGKKVGMTQIFDGDGNSIAVTVIEAGPCKVLEIKNSFGFKVKLGFDPIEEKKLNRPLAGYFKKLNVSPLKTIREFSVKDSKDVLLGQEIKTNIFKPGDYVDISGISIGKGFQGGMKRWNWSGGKSTHGSMHHRRIGSAGSSADPSRTFKGHHMPGQMGRARVTVQGLRVMQIEPENNLLVVRGAVPGHRNTLLEINLSRKKTFESLEVKKAVHMTKKNPMKASKATAKGKA